jgi:hypothetical protein
MRSVAENARVGHARVGQPRGEGELSSVVLYSDDFEPHIRSRSSKILAVAIVKHTGDVISAYRP